MDNEPFVSGTLRIGEQGESRSAQIRISPARSSMRIQITTNAERGEFTTVDIRWPDCAKFAALVCDKTAEMAQLLGK